MISTRDHNIDHLQALVQELKKDDESVGAIVISFKRDEEMFSMYGFNLDEGEILDLLESAGDMVVEAVRKKVANRTLN